LPFLYQQEEPAMPKEDWVFWLNVTNIALGAVVFLAVAGVAYALVSELLSRRKKARDVAGVDDELAALLKYGRTVHGLGVTMADGGDRIAPLPPKAPEEKHK
jgi:hypothetical protein